MLSCEFQYYGLEVMRWKEPANSNLVFGITIDDAVNYDYAQKITSEKDLPKNDIQDYFRAMWDAKSGEVLDWEDENPEALKETGTKGIDVFYSEIMSMVQPTKVQEKLELTFEETKLKLVGRPDFEEKGTLIGDNKTSGKAKPETFIKQGLQPVFYSILKDLNSDNLREVRFDILVKTKVPKVQQQKLVIDKSYRDSTLRFLSHFVQKINESMAAKSFPPTAYFRGGWECGYCPITELCRKTWGLPVPDSKLKKLALEKQSVKNADVVLAKAKKMDEANQPIIEEVVSQVKHLDVSKIIRSIIV